MLDVINALQEIASALKSIAADFGYFVDKARAADARDAKDQADIDAHKQAEIDAAREMERATNPAPQPTE